MPPAKPSPPKKSRRARAGGCFAFLKARPVSRPRAIFRREVRETPAPPAEQKVRLQFPAIGRPIAEPLRPEIVKAPAIVSVGGEEEMKEHVGGRAPAFSGEAE